MDPPILYKKQILTEILVSTALPQEEMILGWQQMKDLDIISHYFPTPCKENRRCCKPDHILQINNEVTGDQISKEETPEEEIKEIQPSSHPPPPPLPPSPHQPSSCQQNLKTGKSDHIEKYP